jgi:hypothetical protein
MRLIIYFSHKVIQQEHHETDFKHARSLTFFSSLNFVGKLMLNLM